MDCKITFFNKNVILYFFTLFFSICSFAQLQNINVTGLGITIPDGDTTPSTSNDTDFGIIDIGSNLDHTFTIENTGSASSTLSLSGSPIVAISVNAAFSILTQPTSTTISGGSNLTFVVRFSPSTATTVTADISIINNDTNENSYSFRVQGTSSVPLTKGTGGITSNLQLWLKANEGLSYTNGQSISLWETQARGTNATVNTPGHEPTFRMIKITMSILIR